MKLKLLFLKNPKGKISYCVNKSCYASDPIFRKQNLSVRHFPIINYLVFKQVITGPKIVQKYLHDPVCFERPEIGQVKFDIRYIILLRSTKPLKVYAYNRFWLRFANQKFEVSLYNFCMLFSLCIFVFLKRSHWCWFLN